ncbi:MAG TPA: hypothetical protein VMS14_07175 [Ilumatobacteraceae bacterium]|nr:hypothetical protein [Ilumatobacteraceae bacterium]
MSRVWRIVFVLGFAGAVAAGCGGQNPYDAAEQTSVSSAAPTVGDNDFVPENQDVSDCISAVEQPNCGSEAKGGWRQYLVMVVLLAGLGFIAWRVVVAVRRRDAIVNAPVEEEAPPVSRG